MTTHVLLVTDQTPMRWVLASGILLVSALVLADDSRRLAVPPAYGEILSDDIYDRAETWREPKTLDDEWRAPKTEPNSRIRFGYDSAYEELRARDHTHYSSRRELQPTTQFQLGF